MKTMLRILKLCVFNMYIMGTRSFAQPISCDYYKKTHGTGVANKITSIVDETSEEISLVYCGKIGTNAYIQMANINDVVIWSCLFDDQGSDVANDVTQIKNGNLAM